MNVRKATTCDLPAIKLLWQEVFEDSEAYIICFINHFGVENCYICEINSEITAMAFAISTNLSQFSIKYIYACATKKQYRGKGIMKNLLEIIYIDACHTDDVAGIFLRPANNSLTKYYQTLGFIDFFYRNELIFKRQTTNNRADASYRPLPTAHFIPFTIYHKKRIQKLKNHYFINWDVGFFRFLYETETRFCEFENTIFSFRDNGNVIIVDELLGELSESEVAHFLLDTYSGATKINVYFSGNEICYGQVKWCPFYNKLFSSGYFAFAIE